MKIEIIICEECRWYNSKIAFCNLYKSCRCKDEFCSRAFPKQGDVENEQSDLPRHRRSPQQ